MLNVIEGLADDWRLLNERIESLSTEIGELACQEPGMRSADDGARHRIDHLERNGRRELGTWNLVHMLSVPALLSPLQPRDEESL
jgi:hypothetical protein